MSTEFVAPFVLSYSYKRSLGPTLSRFMTGLREGRIEGTRTTAGRVLLPPSEYDPETGESVDEWVVVGPQGRIQSWCWDRLKAWWFWMKYKSCPSCFRFCVFW